MTNRIIEVLEEAGRFYFVEEKDEVINKNGSRVGTKC